MKKLLINNELEITASELVALQDLMHENLKDMLDATFQAMGLAISRQTNGSLQSNLSVVQQSLGVIGVNPGVAYTNNKGFIRVGAGEVSLAVPPDDVLYSVVLRHITTNEEEGTVTILDGSSQVDGTGTDFLKLKAGRTVGGNPRPGHIIEIDGTDYTIESISTDVLLFVEEEASGNHVDKPYMIKGNYFTSQPNEYLFEYDTYQVVLKTTALTDDELALATVQYNGSTMTIVDKRGLNLLIFQNEEALPYQPPS